MEVELSLKIRLEQDWMEADQQFRILLFISVLDALVFLGKELEKHNFPGNMVDLPDTRQLSRTTPARSSA